jgi:hypothetical protein
MKSTAKRLLRATIKVIAVLLLCVGILAAVLTLASYPFRREWDEQDRKLAGLLARGASRDEIAAELGTNYFYYVEGGPNWSSVQGFVRNRAAVAARIGTSQRVMYYTTANVMTWIALDDRSRITNYFLCKQ